MILCGRSRGHYSSPSIIRNEVETMAMSTKQQSRASTAYLFAVLILGGMTIFTPTTESMPMLEKLLIAILAITALGFFLILMLLEDFLMTQEQEAKDPQ